MSRLTRLLGFVLSAIGFGAAPASNAFEQKRQGAGEPLFMLISDKEIADAAKSAQSSLSQFRELIGKSLVTDTSPIIKTRFSNSDGGGIWLWLAVRELADDGFFAMVFEAPPEFPNLAAGSNHFILDTQVADWAYVKSGVMHGGYSLRVQRSRLPEEKRASYDGFVGAESYAPLP